MSSTFRVLSTITSQSLASIRKRITSIVSAISPARSPYHNLILFDRLNARESLREKSRVFKSTPRDIENGMDFITIDRRGQWQAQQISAAVRTSGVSNFQIEEDVVSSFAYLPLSRTSLYFVLDFRKYKTDAI